MEKWVYDFSEGSREMRELLGGKGANIAEMTRIGGPVRVPAGLHDHDRGLRRLHARRATFPDGLEEQVDEALARLEAQTGKRLGDPDDPLLVSVRSGARESMPGMLDTVLNLGLNDESVRGPGRAHRQRALRLGLLPALRADVRQRRARHRRASCSRRRSRSARTERGVELDTELDAGGPAARSSASSSGSSRRRRARSSRRSPREQLRQAIKAVFDSWNGERAVDYRRLNRIPDDWGTAVNVQQMVFGNKGETSGSGVAFSRDETHRRAAAVGDFLQNAQGEDVVSGVRNTRDISELARADAGGATRS